MSSQLPLILCGCVLAIMLIIAAVSDLRFRRIPNWLNMLIALGAPIAWWVQGLSLWPDVGLQIGAAVAVFLPFFLMFAVNAMGGGDVKMIVALSLWIAPRMILPMMMTMAIVGGGIAAVMLIRKRMAAANADEGAAPLPEPEVPYGVAIACAGLWAVSQQYINHFGVNTIT